MIPGGSLTKDMNSGFKAAVAEGWANMLALCLLLIILLSWALFGSHFSVIIFEYVSCLARGVPVSIK